MKTICSVTIIVLLLLCTNVAKAQTTQTKLNQVELMKQFLGNWKCEISQDTLYYWDSKSYGTGIEAVYKYVTKGKVIIEGKEVLGYDKSIDKYVMMEMNSKGEDMHITPIWFTSNTKFIEFPDGYKSNLEKTTHRYEGEFKSHDLCVEIEMVNNIPVKTYKFIRIK
jgi:hypothetical protein